MAKSRVSRVSTAVGLAWMVMASLAGTAGTAAAQAPPALGLTVNDATIVFGEPLRVGVTVDNPGGAPAADFVFALLLPDGATLVSAGPGIGVRFGRLSDLRSIVPVVRGVPLAAPFRFQEPSFFNYTFTGIEPQGTYRLLFAAFTAGALDDGAIGAGELLVLASRDFTVSAAPPLTTTDPARKVTTVVPRSGGTVQTVNAAGATLTLTVPANAVPADTTISITPLTTFQDLPLGPLVSGVSLEPSGLTFATPATLTITLPTGYVVPPLGLAGFLADGSGRNLQAVPATVSGRTVTLAVPHFSTSGVALDDSHFDIACDPARVIQTPEKVTACRNLRPLFAAEMARLARVGGEVDRELVRSVVIELASWLGNGLTDRMTDAATPDPADPFRKARAVGEEWLDFTYIFEPLIGISDRDNQARLDSRLDLFTFGAVIDSAQLRLREAFLAAMSAINVKCLANKPTVNDSVSDVLLMRGYWILQFPASNRPTSLPFDEVFCVDIRINATPPTALSPGVPASMPIDLRIRFIDNTDLPGPPLVVAITSTNGTVAPAGGTLPTPITNPVTLTPTATSTSVTITAAFGASTDFPIFESLPVRSRTFDAGQATAVLDFTNGALGAGGRLQRFSGVTPLPDLEFGATTPQLGGTATASAGLPGTPVTVFTSPTARGYVGGGTASVSRTITRGSASIVVSLSGQANHSLDLFGNYGGPGAITSGVSDSWCVQPTAPVQISASSFGALTFRFTTASGQIVSLVSGGVHTLTAGRWCLLYTGEIGRQASQGEVFGETSGTFNYTLTFAGVR